MPVATAAAVVAVATRAPRAPTHATGSILAQSMYDLLANSFASNLIPTSSQPILGKWAAAALEAAAEASAPGWVLP